MSFMRVSLAALTLAVGVSASSANAASSNLISPTGPLNVGDAFSLTWQVMNVPEFDGVGFGLTYDSDVVSYTGGVFSAVFNAFAVDQLANAQAAEALGGLVTVESLTAGTFLFPSGDLDIVTLNFEAVAAGITDIVIDPFQAFGQDLMFTRFGAAVFNTTDTARIVVEADPITTPIPLPASALLLGAAVLGLAGQKRRTRHK
ncbi:hypothetical protein DKT77_16735 [Meridianimarinicoccus roseus]|uniref:Uncharacterized protein n=1 Tax=Meridianimarinicoccus roseus TaxID=2072018 RepID=A0A2V2LE22_9RHOB|nr:cohesin domain-containing protein [Meridianimarinicoccus roseus]PWR01477.1 hypothetical protein DKT77_16735 [Meridianimarinicoccus roseus]